MSNPLRVNVICEGQTEQSFVNKILAPYMLSRGGTLIGILLEKSGQNGGDVKFDRARKQIENLLKNDKHCIVSTFVDYYGIKEWPGIDGIPQNATPEQIADAMNSAAKQAIAHDLPQCYVERRFIPFTAVHEFEMLFFCDPSILADYLSVDQAGIDNLLNECGSPERINNGVETAPSKRLENWKRNYRKNIDGKAIAERIGIDKMREKSPLFNAWLCELESLQN